VILGIDASNIRHGGGVTHIVEVLRAANPSVQGFSQVIVWSGRSTLEQIEHRPWLVKAELPVLNKGLLRRALWQRFLLSRAARRAGCDVLFVPGGSFAGDFRPMVTMSQNLLPFQWTELRRFGFSWMTLKGLALRRSQSATFKRADGVLFLTAYARDAVQAVAGPLPGRTAVVPHGVNPVFTAAPRPQMPASMFSAGRPFRLLYVSMIDMYKHQWHVAEAVGVLRRRGYAITLDLIGPAYPRALERLNRTLGSVNGDGVGVRYLGAVPHSEVHAHYQSADAAVFASSCETFGQILTEAMSAGLPIACSSRSAMPEVLGDAGVFFDPEDPQDIARALERLIGSHDLRYAKARSAYRRAGQLSWSKCADETLAFIRDCAGAGPGPAR
jgi:glycosyltransferase involved in cell wall biosynthesis